MQYNAVVNKQKFIPQVNMSETTKPQANTAFGVRRSAFGVRRSAFGVRRSAFGVQQNTPAAKGKHLKQRRYLRFEETVQGGVLNRP